MEPATRKMTVPKSNGHGVDDQRSMDFSQPPTLRNPMTEIPREVLNSKDRVNPSNNNTTGNGIIKMEDKYKKVLAQSAKIKSTLAQFSDARDTNRSPPEVEEYGPGGRHILFPTQKGPGGDIRWNSVFGASKAVCDPTLNVSRAVINHLIYRKGERTGVNDHCPIALRNESQNKEVLNITGLEDSKAGERQGEIITGNQWKLNGYSPHNRCSPVVTGGLCTINISPSWADVVKLSEAKKDIDTERNGEKNTGKATGKENEISLVKEQSRLWS